MAAQPSSASIDQLIICSPYEKPSEHWKYNRETRRFSREPDRRPAGYIRASDASKSFDDPGEFVELPLVNKIRPARGEVAEPTIIPGPAASPSGCSSIGATRNSGRASEFFFCQLEAIETLMWLAEAPESERVGIKVPGDGGEFTRLCSKMATGSGKTILMAMLIAWQVLNKVTYPQDKRFSKNILLIAPGLDGEEPTGSAGSGQRGELLPRIPDCPAGTRRQATARADVPSAGAQLAQAGLGERRADKQKAQRGQTRSAERRGLRARSAGRDALGGKYSGDQ